VGRDTPAAARGLLNCAMRSRSAAVAAALSAAALFLPSAARAGGVEISGFAGYTFPFYSQKFAYNPGPISVPIPGVSIDQSGAFELKAKGGPAFGGAIAFYPSETFGFELRLDRAEIDVQTQSTTFDVKATLPAGLDPVEASLTLDDGEATLSAPFPFSLNVKLRGAGPTHLFVSGGLSRLGSLDVTLHQPIAIGVANVNLDTGNLEIPTLTVQAAATDTGRTWGGNLGLGFQIALGERGGLVVEGRGFYFSKRTIAWEGVNVSGLPAIQQELLSRTLENLPPVEFKPWWVQATIGFSYRF
jgi:hypothetical protein